MNSNTNDTPIVGRGTGLVDDGISSAAAEKRSQNTNSSTSCVSSISRKRQFNVNMLDGNGDTNNAVAASSKHIETQPLSQNNIKQQKSIRDMQIKLDTVEKEKEELKSELIRRNVEIGDMRVELNKVHNRRVEFEQRCIELTQRNQELENTVKDLTLQLEYNEWTYTAEIMPCSYWLSRGYSQVTAEQVPFLTKKIRSYARQLRKGKNIEKINLYLLTAGNTDKRLRHDEALLPHWKELMSALQQYQKFAHRDNYGLKSIGISKIELQPTVIKILSPVLKATKVRLLDFTNNNIGGQELSSFIADIVQSNPSIDHVNLEENHIDNLDDMRRLCNSTSCRVERTHLNCLSLCKTFDGNNPEMMHTLLDSSCHIAELIFNGNGIRLMGATVLANFLASNPPLKLLEIDDNIDDNSTTLLANSLQSNTNLKIMSMAWFDDPGQRQSFLDTVFNASSLNACAASNHTCSISGYEQDISFINRLEKATHNKAMKIFAILSATDDAYLNLNHLVNVSYKSIPEVLCLAQRFTSSRPLSQLYMTEEGRADRTACDQVNENTVPLTSVYELLRGWAVPALS